VTGKDRLQVSSETGVRPLAGENAKMPRYVVTLVHGTFARGAAWTRSDSKLCRELRNALGPHRTVIRRFLWSGWNSPWSRNKAAIELREQLAGQLSEFPDAEHFLVGHSHGGAVALQSLRGHQAIEDRISGVAALSTPFVETRERAVESSEFRTMFPWFLFISLVGIAIYFLFEYEMGPETKLVSEEFELPLFLASTLLAAIVGVVLSHRLGDAILQLAIYTKESLQCPVRKGSNLLIIRCIGDEASALLASESRRVFRRPHCLRGWGHGKTEQVFTRGTGAGCPNGA